METKTCRKCGETKPLDRFYRSGTVVAGQCKPCQRARANELRAERKRKGILRPRPGEESARTKFRLWLWEQKSKPCTDCGNTYHPVSMQFDHLPGTEKKFPVNVSAALLTFERVLEEMAKCELVCANCHHLRTWRRKHPTDDF